MKFLIVVLSLSLYACSDKNKQFQVSEPSSSPKNFSACNFLTADAIKEIFENEVEKEIGIVDSTICIYKFKSGNYLSISLTLRNFNDSQTAHKVFNEKLKSIKNQDAIQKIFNLGEDAFWIGKEIHELNILKGNNIFELSVVTSPNIDESELSAKCILLSEKFIK
ncbi:MAG: hypothetical protein ACP5P3_01695 [Ignavibacteria bacterium]